MPLANLRSRHLKRGYRYDGMNKAQTTIDFLKGYKRALIEEERIINMIEHEAKQKGNDRSIKELRERLEAPGIKKLRARLGTLEIKKGEVVQTIEECTDGYFCRVLSDYYVCELTFEEIAADIGYSTRHVQRLHDKAVEKISKRMKK